MPRSLARLNPVAVGLIVDHAGSAGGFLAAALVAVLTAVMVWTCFGSL